MSLTGASSSVTPSSTDVFTNKTINSDDNTITNLASANFKAGEVVGNLGPAQPDYVKPASAKAVQDSLDSKTTELQDYAKAQAIKYSLIFG